MKNFVQAMLLAMILIVGSTVQAAQVRVYDYGVDNFTNALNRAGVEFLDSGYGRDGNGRYFAANCFQNNGSRNKIVFRLNDDGTVAAITVSANQTNDMINSSTLGTLLYKIGLSDAEVDKLWNEMINGINNNSQVTPSGDMFNGTFSAWCDKSQRYVDVHCRIGLFDGTITITAHV